MHDAHEADAVGAQSRGGGQHLVAGSALRPPPLPGFSLILAVAFGMVSDAEVTRGRRVKRVLSTTGRPPGGCSRRRDRPRSTAPRLIRRPRRGSRRSRPAKIVAVHLTYRSRLVEYDARQPAEPSYFMKPPAHAERPPRRDPPPARRALPQLRGRARRRRRQRSMHGVPQDDVLDYVYGFAPANDVGPARLPPRRPRLDAARQGPGRLPADRPRRRHERRVVARRRLHAADVPERRGRPARRLGRHHLGLPLPARRPLRG